MELIINIPGNRFMQITVIIELGTEYSQCLFDTNSTTELSNRIIL